MADRTKPPKGLLVTGLVLLLLSFGGCGVGCFSFLGFASELSDLADDVNSVPLGTTTTLSATGEAGVILTSGTTSNVSCSVRSDSGEVDLQSPGPGTTGTIEDGSGSSYDLRYIFETDPGTNYEVVCSDEVGGQTGEYLVIPFPGFSGIFVGLGTIVAGFFLFVVGLIFLIVGLVKRSKWKKNNNNNAGPYGGPAPGAGYAPPAPGQPQGGYAPPPGAGPTFPLPGQGPPPMQTPPPPPQTPPPMPPGPPAGNPPPPSGPQSPPPFGN